jgi:hypothetical protein
MSKGRELLKRVRDTLRELKETHYDLYWDIQAELDLDEQVPVAWMSTKGEGGLTDDSYYANHKDYVPLYLAPQKREPAQTAREMYQRGYAKAKDDLKREPFGPEIRERMSKAYNTKCEQIAFQEGIVFAEISHGIGVVE